MAQEALLREGTGRELDRLARMLYSDVASRDELDDLGVAQLEGENPMALTTSPQGYEVAVSSGEQPLTLVLNDGVTLSFVGRISLDVVRGKVEPIEVPEILTDFEFEGSELKRIFATNVLHQLEQRLIESGRRIYTHKEALSLLDLEDTLLGSKLDVVRHEARKFKPVAPVELWDSAWMYLIDTTKTHVEEIPDGGQRETAELTGIWGEEEAVGIVTREKSNQEDAIVYLGIATEFGFLVKFNDGTEHLLEDLDIILSKDKAYLKTDEGEYVDLPRTLDRQVLNFLQSDQTEHI